VIAVGSVDIEVGLRDCVISLGAAAGTSTVVAVPVTLGAIEIDTILVEQLSARDSPDIVSTIRPRFAAPTAHADPGPGSRADTQIAGTPDGPGRSGLLTILGLSGYAGVRGTYEAAEAVGVAVAVAFAFLAGARAAAPTITARRGSGADVVFARELIGPRALFSD